MEALAQIDRQDRCAETEQQGYDQPETGTAEALEAVSQFTRNPVALLAQEADQQEQVDGGCSQVKVPRIVSAVIEKEEITDETFDEQEEDEKVEAVRFEDPQLVEKQQQTENQADAGAENMHPG